MLPGLTSKLSEQVVASTTSIDQHSDIILLTGSTAIATIQPHFGGGFSGIVIIVPTDGTIATTTVGNISLVVTMPQSRATVLVYCKSTGLWYPGAIS